MEQKFFTTGHSFNDCDRKFGMIEKKKRATTLVIPADIQDLIRESSLAIPFTPVAIQQADILDHKTHAKNIRYPSGFRITQHLYYMYSKDNPEHLFSKNSHDNNEPVRAHLLRINSQFNQLPPRAKGTLSH